MNVGAIVCFSVIYALLMVAAWPATADLGDRVGLRICAVFCPPLALTVTTIVSIGAGCAAGLGYFFFSIASSTDEQLIQRQWVLVA